MRLDYPSGPTVLTGVLTGGEPSLAVLGRGDMEEDRGTAGLNPLLRVQALQTEQGAVSQATGAKRHGSLEKLEMTFVGYKEAAPWSKPRGSGSSPEALASTQPCPCFGFHLRRPDLARGHRAGGP